MPVPDITLDRPFILVTRTTSSLGISVLNNAGTDLSFGNVELVYETCDTIAIGDSILFNAKIAASILYGSTVYYLVNINDNVTFKEVLPPNRYLAHK